MWFLHLLIQSWRERLAGLHELAAEPSGSQWLWLARARILRFLISRYSAEPVGAVPVGHPALKDKPRVTVCVVEACDAPPRTREDLASIFLSIRRENLEAQRRLRWRWF